MNLETVPWQAEGFDLDDALAKRIRTEYLPDPEDVEAFRRDGVALLRGASAEWVDTLRRGLERNLANPDEYAYPCESVPAPDAGRFFDSYCNWQRIPEYLDYVMNSGAAAMAARFMDSPCAQFFHEHAFAKEPGTQMATPWHQDLPYYCVDGTRTVSIYIALDPAPADVAVRFVAGSHRWGKLYSAREFESGEDYEQGDNPLDTAPDVNAAPESFDLRSWALEPGDTILFDFRVLHGTTDARIKMRRRAFSTRWLGDDVRYCERPGQTSPPYPGIGLKPGDRMREDWFPILWGKLPVYSGDSTGR